MILDLRTADIYVYVLLSQLAKFDFRNGPLRRKFDAVKYAVKKLEGILYDLAINDKRPKLGMLACRMLSSDHVSEKLLPVS